MLYLELCKLLKMLILVNMIIKDMVYALMKVNERKNEMKSRTKEGNFNHTTLARNVIIFGVDMSLKIIIKKTIFTLWVKIMFKN